MNMVTKIWQRIQYLKTHKSEIKKIKISPEIIKKASELVMKEQKASVMLIKTKLKLGYAESVKVFKILENKGIIGPFNSGEPRKVAL